MGRWTFSEENKGYKKFLIATGAGGKLVAYSKPWAILICDAHNADCDRYEARIAELEEERDAAVEFAHTMDLQNADYGRVVDELARVKAGPHFVQYVDRLNEIYARHKETKDDAARHFAMDALCRQLANESDEFMAQRDAATKQQEATKP